MSTLKADNLTKRTGSGAPDLGGVAANRLIPTAWVNFNGTGVVAIRDAHNVASITDTGVGGYGVNFTTVMDNANYVLAGAVQRTVEGNNGNGMFSESLTSARTASRVDVRASDSTTGFIDSAIVSVVVFGGKA